MILPALAVSLLLSPTASLRTLPDPPPQVAFARAEEPGTVGAAAWALYSVDGETMLWENDADRQRPMASVTKVMTALITARRSTPSAPVPISATAQNTGIGYPGQPRVLQGDTWTVEELLDNILVQSGNDASVALAEHIAGSLDGFVDIMNATAAELGMTGTSFANPHGLDAPGHYSTPRDLVRLGVAAVAEPRVTRAARIKALTFDPVQRQSFSVRNTNRLLGSFPGVFGLKTGDTANAGLVLLSYLDTGTHRFIGVVMNAGSHFDATTELLGYAAGMFRPSDYLLAPLLPADVTDVLPEWLRLRLAATGPLPTGADRLSPPGTTPGERALVDGLGGLLPGVLGGSG